MAKVPQPNARRYRGRLNHAMRSALHHLQILVKWDGVYRGKAITYYPNQLAPLPEVTAIATAALQIGQWLQARGPIPSR